MKRKFLVIDVYALSYRALYGYPDLENDKGEPTSVIIGFFKQLLSRVRNPEQYYPVFVTDAPGSCDANEGENGQDNDGGNKGF